MAMAIQWPHSPLSAFDLPSALSSEFKISYQVVAG